MLIDDVKVTSAPTFLAAPKVVGVTDFQADRFTIEWQPLRKAFEYYVDLYKMTYTSDTDGAFSEDFETTPHRRKDGALHLLKYHPTRAWMARRPW